MQNVQPGSALLNNIALVWCGGLEIGDEVGDASVIAAVKRGDAGPSSRG